MIWLRVHLLIVGKLHHINPKTPECGRTNCFSGQTELCGVVYLKIFLQITVKIELEFVVVLILWKLMEILNYLSFCVLLCFIGVDAQ